MGLIKHSQIEEKGTILLDRPQVEIRRRVKPAAPPPSSEIEVSLAESEADRILREAHDEAGEVREKAREEGLRLGKEEVFLKLQEALDTLNQAVKERKKIIKDAEAEILRLALRVAEQILRSEVSLNRDVVLNIVTEAISRVSDREQIIVKVNREDVDSLKRHKDRLAGMLDGVRSFSIVEDESIEPGGCIIETNLGFVDARISTKLKSIEEAFHKINSQ